MSGYGSTTATPIGFGPSYYVPREPLSGSLHFSRWRVTCSEYEVVDFWNSQAGWNSHASRGANNKVIDLCDWKRLPVVLTSHAGELLATMGIEGPFSLEETIVHASVDKSNNADEGLRRWLSNTIDRLPSYNVTIHERKPRPASMHCNVCGTQTTSCLACGTPYRRSVEKGVDTALATDLLSLGFEGVYDVALLVSSDADFVPCGEVPPGQGPQGHQRRLAGERSRTEEATLGRRRLERLQARHRSTVVGRRQGRHTSSPDPKVGNQLNALLVLDVLRRPDRPRCNYAPSPRRRDRITPACGRPTGHRVWFPGTADSARWCRRTTTFAGPGPRESLALAYSLTERNRPMRR